MKKRTLALMMASIMAAGALAGCASTSTPPPVATDAATEAAEATTEAKTDDAATSDLYSGEPITMRMMIWGNADDYTPSNEALLKQFPEMDAKVDFSIELGGSGDADVAEKFRLMLASGEELPDLIRLNYTQFPEFADAGVLYDLSDAIAPYVDDIIPAAQQLMTWNGGTYAVPHEVKPKVWFYRSDMFGEAGINPDEVKTVDDFIAAAEKFHEKFPDSYIENYATPLNNYDLTMMLCATGGSFCDEEGNYHCATDEGVRKAFENLKKLHDSDAFAPVVEWDADWQADFANDTLASQLIGGWMKDHLINWTPENAGKWAMATWPEEIRTGSESDHCGCRRYLQRGACPFERRLCHCHPVLHRAECSRVFPGAASDLYFCRQARLGSRQRNEGTRDGYRRRKCGSSDPSVRDAGSEHGGTQYPLHPISHAGDSEQGLPQSGGGARHREKTCDLETRAQERADSHPDGYGNGNSRSVRRVCHHRAGFFMAGHRPVDGQCGTDP